MTGNNDDRGTLAKGGLEAGPRVAAADLPDLPDLPAADLPLVHEPGGSHARDTENARLARLAAVASAAARNDSSTARV